MITVKRLIGLALQEIGVIGASEEPTAEDVADALDYLRMMLNAWGVDHMLVPVVTRESFNSLGQRIFTIGAGGDFDTRRPIAIATISIDDGSGTEHYVDQVSENVLDKMPTKDVVSDFPRYFHYSPDYPLGRIEFSSVMRPDHTVYIRSSKPLDESLVLTEEMALPDNYQRLVMLGLAIEIANSFGKAVPAELAAKFQYSYTTTKRSNAATRVPTLSVDEAMLQTKRYDIKSGP